MQYAAKWLEIVESTDATALQQCFAPAAGGADATKPTKLLALSVPLPQVVRLVSTVGATHIKASFLGLPAAGGGPARFGLALAASNSLGARVSSYYQAAAYQPAAPGEGLTGAVPNLLVQRWRQLWQQAAQVEPAMFAGAYGPLRGYTFELDDFVTALTTATSPDRGQLVLYFGLHEYYRPDPAAGDLLAQTFGLILQLRGAGQDQAGGGDPFYDMSAPCPPTC